MDISVIVPVFRGENSVQKLFEGIRENLLKVGTFEVLFIYDQGPDNSWEILKMLKSKNPEEIRIFKLKKNYGQHDATLYGINEARGNIIITMDEDLQHDPIYLIPLLKKHQENNFNVVYGRFHDPKHPYLRKIASAILQKSLKYLIPGLGYYSSYRLIKKEVAHKLGLLKNSYTFIDANIIKLTSEIGFLDIDHRANTERKSNYNILRLIRHAIQIILAYTRFTKYLMISSILLLISNGVLFALYPAGRAFQTLILITGITVGILGILAELYHKFEIRTNLLPVISIENE